MRFCILSARWEHAHLINNKKKIEIFQWQQENLIIKSNCLVTSFNIFGGKNHMIHLDFYRVFELQVCEQRNVGSDSV